MPLKQEKVRHVANLFYFLRKASTTALENQSTARQIRQGLEA